MANPNGRPSGYKPEYCDIAIDFLAKGKGFIQLATHLRVAKSTLQKWEKEHDDLSAAIEMGMTFSESKWMDDGEENIANKDYSVRMYELQMMNRFGWKRKIEEKNNQNINLNVTEKQKNDDIRNEFKEP